MSVLLLIVACWLAQVSAFVHSASGKLTRLQPLHENFFLGIGEDPAENTPKELYGEVSYQNFVRSTNTKGLLVDEYDLITRLRETQLLGLIAESGLLEELESKGLTLSKLEKLLPLFDELRLLEILYKNKDLALSLAPLVVEPAPIMIPLVVAMLKVPASAYTAAGVALVGLSGYEIVAADNSLLGVPLLLLAAPLLVLGNVFKAPDVNKSAAPVPSVAKTATAASAAPASVPASVKLPTISMSVPRLAKLPAAPALVEKVKSAAAPKAKAAPPSGGTTRVRKTVRINKK